MSVIIRDPSARIACILNRGQKALHVVRGSCLPETRNSPESPKDICIVTLAVLVTSIITSRVSTCVLV